MSMLQFVRHAGRYREMLSVLVQFGFREFFEDAKLDLLLERGRRVFHRGPSEEIQRMGRPKRLRLALEALGPTFIKLGQVLSTRPDILPPEYIEEFQHLQDNVPSVPWPEIKKQMLEDLGDFDEFFQSIDEVPMAAASMAQAHRAVLKDGQPIVLKVLRPGIARIVTEDLEILHSVAEWVARHHPDLPFDAVAVVEEFQQAMGHELDLMHEARNIETFRRRLEDEPSTYFPEVYWSVTRNRVLGLEEIKGTQLSHWKQANLSPEERKKIVEIGAGSILRQVLDIGFFHADPHPGNMFWLDDQRLCFIDCGMAGRVDHETVNELANLLYGVATSDIGKVYEAFIALGNVREETISPRAVRRDLQDFMDQFTGVSFEKIQMSAVLQSFADGLRKHRIQCPGDIVLMIKALSTIEGVGEDLDPEFDLVGYAQPQLEALVKRQYSREAIWTRLKNSTTKYIKLAEHLPHRVSSILERFSRNEVRVGVEIDGLQQLTRTMKHSSRQLSYTLLIAAMILASSVLVLAADKQGSVLGWIGFVGFLVSFVLAFFIVMENIVRRNA
ncbi:MAG: AarF/ABC1/UbiB kinase family protein [Phycisphaerales bacterium]|nr:AarF/ABC1/UbiB kinase family protein [Phycisphaerales bacterium]